MPNCKYKKLKQQQSFDGGNSWIDVYQSGLLVTKKGDLIERNSSDCGYEGEYIRWVVVDGYLCDYTTYNKYKKEKKQKSTDNKTWTDVSPAIYRRGALLESNSADCRKSSEEKHPYDKWVDEGDVCGDKVPSGATESENVPNDKIYERWVEDEGKYICDGSAKYKKLVLYVSSNGSTWTKATPEQSKKGDLISAAASDCVPNSFKLTYVTTSNLETVLITRKQECFSRIIVDDTNKEITIGTGDLYLGFNGVIGNHTITCVLKEGLKSLSGLFKNCKRLTKVGDMYKYTRGVTRMSEMFGGCSSLQEAPNINTRECMHMAYMFYGCTMLSKVPAYQLNAAYTVNYMFYNCLHLNDSNCPKAYDGKYYWDYKKNYGNTDKCFYGTKITIAPTGWK